MPNLNPTRIVFTALALLGAAGIATPATPMAVDPQLVALVANPARTPAYVARDAARHPAEELQN